MVGNAHDQSHVVLDQDHRNAQVGNLAEKLGELIFVGAHQAGGGLIKQEHVGPAGERAGDFDEATIDMRQVGGGRGQRTEIADKGEHRFGGSVFLGGLVSDQHDTEASTAKRDQHIVDDAQRAEQLGGLIGAGDSGARHFPGLRARKIGIAEPHRAGIGPIETAYDVQYSGFPGAVRTDDARHLAGLGIE